MMQVYDVAFVGHYTKDTIVSAAGTRVVDGGAFNYGAHVAARMGLHVAAITRLAHEDRRVVEELKALGVTIFARTTPQSTCLRLVYPSANVDERVIYVMSTAGAFTRQEAAGVRARTFVIGPSMRGEVGLDLVESLAAKGALIAVDVQGFVRVERAGRLAYEAWPEREALLAHVDILKADAAEAQILTGQSDIRLAARVLAGLGPAEIVLTHRDGLLVYADGQSHEARFHPAQLVGRSGRGDTCLAAYVCGRLTRFPAEATVWAAAVTSLKMESEGPFRRNLYEVKDMIRRQYR